MNTPRRYTKKPVTIEAMQVSQETYTALAEWFTANGVDAWVPFPTQEEKDDPEYQPYMMIPTLEGEMRANIGDWIIKGVQGEFYPIDDDVFRQTYEAVDGS